MKTMKQVLALVLALCLLVTCAACGKKDKGGDTTTSTTATTTAAKDLAVKPAAHNTRKPRQKPPILRPSRCVWGGGITRIQSPLTRIPTRQICDAMDGRSHGVRLYVLTSTFD